MTGLGAGGTRKPDVTIDPSDPSHPRLSDSDRPLSDPAVTDALIWAILDAVPDGLLLVDHDGLVMLANTHLERMFGYDRADLLGQPVETLVPERVRDAHDGHRAEFAAAPRVRAMGHGLDLVGRRRDGGDLPIDIRLSPLPTATGMCVIAVIREDTTRRVMEHDRTAASVDDEARRIAGELGDTIIRSLFGAGLRLHTIAPQVGDKPREELRQVVADLDSIIREIRNVVFPFSRSTDPTGT